MRVMLSCAARRSPALFGRCRVALIVTSSWAIAASSSATPNHHRISLSTMASDSVPDKEELRKKLAPLAYSVTQEKGTERAWTSEFNTLKAKGTFKCVCCGQELFLSDAKFDSGSGWPSFFEPAAKEAVKEHSDVGHGMVRTEVTCSKCGAHLGHVFDDGPRDKTGLRYCINGVALDFEKKAS